MLVDVAEKVGEGVCPIHPSALYGQIHWKSQLKNQT